MYKLEGLGKEGGEVPWVYKLEGLGKEGGEVPCMHKLEGSKPLMNKAENMLGNPLHTKHSNSCPQ